ncbi:hypothetical protein [uncultured Akkermansia sp.]|uniref:hypothetical protein n=3 Tax=uncultured Akkermansia sp. TaxID=512294 RepID=UPI00261896E5|nr:hypothetical protein [uncultured Akkermansia sp.]
MKMSKHPSCLIHRNLLTGISYSDATPGQSFAYDHLGQLTQITDAAGTRIFACNPYGEPETDSLEANGLAWQVSELYDGLGRPAGYELSAGERRVQQARLSYDGKGRLSALAAEGMENLFSWIYLEREEESGIRFSSENVDDELGWSTTTTDISIRLTESEAFTTYEVPIMTFLLLMKTSDKVFFNEEVLCNMQ